MKNNFCIAPFVQHTTHPSGSFSPCPYLGGTVWKEQHTDIIAQWQSAELEELRDDFIANKQNPICERCWHEERNDKRSLRLRLYDPIEKTSDYGFASEPGFMDKLNDSIADKSYLSGPQVLTIKNGNVCNAKCRSCHPGDSSRWIKDSVQLKEITGKDYYSINQIEKNWTEKQIEELLTLSKSLVRLELFGGEPTYNKKVIALLNQIIDNGDAEHIVLYINTNGSVDIVDKLPRIGQFKQVEIGVSIDGVGAHFDYLRHGVKYDDVVTNVNKWVQFFTDNDIQYSIDAITTVDIFNIYYLPEIKQAVEELLPLPPFWNLLVNPAYLFIKNMPDCIKDAVHYKLSADSEFDDLLNVMGQVADPAEWDKFLEVTPALDTIRGENASEVFPELYKLIVT